MLGQTALLVDLDAGAAEPRSLDGLPFYVGAVDACVQGGALGLFRGDAGPGAVTSLAGGLLAGTPVSGANHLAVAMRDRDSGSLAVAALAGLGLPFDGLGHSPVLLRGRAARPSILLLTQRAGGVRMRLEALDAEAVWRGARAEASGSLALLALLLERFTADFGSALAFFVGPAAARTRYGALLATGVEAGRLAPAPIEATRRGGLGSQLWQQHGLCALVLGGERDSAALLARAGAAGCAQGAFEPRADLAALEGAVGHRFAPELVREGPAIATLAARGPSALAFNAATVGWSSEQRHELWEHWLRPGLLVPLRAAVQRDPAAAQPCAAPCPVACRTVAVGRVREAEPLLWLGPQLGIFDLAAHDRLLHRCLTDGFDVPMVGALLGWLLERVHRGELDARALGLAERPLWSLAEFSSAGSAAHNGPLAEALLDGLLYAPWAQALRGGLRVAADDAGAEAAGRALVLELDGADEVVPEPDWTIGGLAPLPFAGEGFAYAARHWVAPAALGVKTAERLVAQLALLNSGLCFQHRAWLELHYPRLARQLYGESCAEEGWIARHRTLARRLHQQARPRPWRTGRLQHWVGARLLEAQREGLADSELERWLRRFADDAPAAARAFWTELDLALSRALAT